MCVAILSDVQPGEDATPCEPTHSFQDHLSQHEAEMAHRHLILHLNFPPLLICTSSQLFEAPVAISLLLPKHRASLTRVVSQGLCLFNSFTMLRGQQLNSHKMLLCSTNFQLCGPLPASGSFTVKLRLPEALHITKKYFDTWQVLLLKTCFLKKKCPSCSYCDVNPPWALRTVAAAQFFPPQECSGKGKVYPAELFPAGCYLELVVLWGAGLAEVRQHCWVHWLSVFSKDVRGSQAVVGTPPVPPAG